jgi:hypothetical protein
MTLLLRASAFAAVLLVAACAPSSTDLSAQDAHFVVPDWPGERWYLGNTHTHTTESDGDTPPAEVTQWYRDHGYHFLVLSDHNTLTDPGTLAHLTDSAFILIPGEEVTSSFESASVHVNGLNLPSYVDPREGSTLVETIQNNVDAVRAVEGVPHINHPNFQWSFGADELRQVERYRLLEIHNGHPTVHNHGGGDTPGLEEIWDMLLTAGKVVYGIAVDDAHHFQGEFARDRANPGRGWVRVRAASLEPNAVMDALENGWFYASSGPEIADIRVTDTRIEIELAFRGSFRHTTTFIGPGGDVLESTGGEVATYELTGRELVDDGAGGEIGYVRARIVDSMGYAAWTQPIFVERR